MKKLILLIICFNTIYTQAQWQFVGPENFTGSNAEFQSLETYNGEPYLAFKDFDNSLKTTVMKFDGTSWVAVGSAGLSAGLAERQSLAISSTGVPYVAYSDYTNSEKVTVKKYDGTNWVTVGSGGISANHQSYGIDLVFDNNDIPYVVYVEGTSTKVKKFNGTSWVNMGTGLPSNNNTKLAFDANNVLYLCGADGFNGKALVYKLVGTTWTAVGSTGYVSIGQAYYISFAVDSLTPYVAYTDVPYANKLTVMKFDGSSWVSVGSAGFTAAQVFDPVVRIDDNHIPFVAYRGDDTKVSVLKFVGGSWLNVGQADFTPTLVTVATLDFELENGIPYIAYKNYSNNKASVMKYTMPSTIQVLGLKESTFGISPNPVSTTLEIRTQEIIQQVNILSVNGQVLKSTKNASISVVDLPQGIYIVELKTVEGVSYKQFVKK